MTDLKKVLLIKANVLLYIFSFSALSILYNYNFAWVIDSYIYVCPCVCILTPRVYSTLYLCYSIHYTEIMWADAIRIHMKTKPIQGWGRRLFSEEITPSLTSDLTIFIWLFPYMNSATPKMKWELRRKSVHVCVCVGQIIYNPGSTGKTLLCLKHIYFIYIKYLYVHIFTQDLLKQILNYFPNLLTCEKKGLS